MLSRFRLQSLKPGLSGGVTQLGVQALGVVALRGQCACSISFDPGERVDGDDGVEHIMSVSKIMELGPCLEGACPGAYVEIFPLVDAAWATDLPFMSSAPAQDSQALSAVLERAARELRRLEA